jgi:hypothetical protein
MMVGRGCDVGRKLKCGGCGNELDLTGYGGDDPFSADGSFIVCGGCMFPNPADHRPADFKFSAVVALARPYKAVLLANDSLKTVREAFDRNMDRVVSLTRLPRALSLHWQFLASGGPPRVGLLTVGQPGQAAPRPIWTHMRHDPGFQVDQVFANVSSGVYIGIETLLSSMVIGTWTACETLAGDLWESALNAEPAFAILAGRPADRIEKLCAGKPKQTKNGGPSTGAEEPKSEPADKAISLRTIARLTQGKYNLGGMMGTVLRQSGSVKFDTLPKIREAYSRAFMPGPKAVDTALSNRHLDALCIVRNLLVHRSGTADYQYEQECKGIPEAPQLNAGDSLNLDGKAVSGMIEPVIKACTSLLKGVDAFITAERHGQRPD